MPLPLYVRTTRFTQFPHFSSRWPAVPHWEWMFTTVDRIFYDRVEVNDRLTENSCFSGLWPVNLLLTQTLHCTCTFKLMYHTHTQISVGRKQHCSVDQLALTDQCVCVSECSCVRTVSDLLGEFSHFSTATWLSCLPLSQSRAGQSCICHSQLIHIWGRLSLQITQSHLAEMLSEQNCSCRSKHYHFKSGHIWGIFINRAQTATWLSCILK